MELRVLEQFVAVAEMLHFGRAAERLHMSQPPLSMAMQRLEQEVGVRLLDRNRRGVRLTAAGTVFLGEARQLLAGVEHAVQRARMTARGESGSLRVGCIGPAVAAGLPEVLQQFMREVPGVRVQLDEQVSVRQMGMLMEGALDIALIRRHGVLPDWCATRLFCRDVYVAALPQAHALAGESRIELADLRKDALILYPRQMGVELYDAVIAACMEAGFSPHIVQEVATKSTTLALVAAGTGVAFVPASLARAGYNGVRFVPLQGALPCVEMCWAWRRDSTNPAVPRFLACAAQLGMAQGDEG